MKDTRDVKMRLDFWRKGEKGDSLTCCMQVIWYYMVNLEENDQSRFVEICKGEGREE